METDALTVAMHALPGCCVEDSLKDRMEDQRKGNYVITSEELEDVMEEAMHVLWEFIKADRAETTTTAAAASVLKGLSSSNVELQDPLDHGLMAHIHSALQKVNSSATVLAASVGVWYLNRVRVHCRKRRGSRTCSGRATASRRSLRSPRRTGPTRTSSSRRWT
jgi:hypothetical protein